jgi:hypothetical protein
MTREALAASGGAAILSAILVWLGPPGIDFAAHVYQRALFLQHGFALWNNFWYAGRYSFVTYSLLYYPLAALLGIRLLAVVMISVATLAFAVVVLRQWGPRARWSSRTFAVVWAGTVLSAAFPFELGTALALLAILALQSRRIWRFALLAVLTLAASPLAFLLLALVLAGVAIGRHPERRTLIGAGLAIGVLGLAEIGLWRIFPGNGIYPFSGWELAAALVFCAFGVVLSWRIDGLNVLQFVFPVYGAACIVAFVVPSALGENVDRVRYVALPVAVLLLTLRNWRPRLLAVVAFSLALSWNVTPLVDSFAKASDDPAAQVSFWQPAIAYLHRHLTASFRVEAVDTVGHWEALYLPRAGIPLARGWFRQDDFPQNALLYDDLGANRYVAWLRSLGVGYVVLSTAPPDYSAVGERKLLLSGRLPLRVVFASRTTTIYAVPQPEPIVTGPSRSRVMSLRGDGLTLKVGGRGTYRIAIRYTPYWHPSAGCVWAGKDGMIRLQTTRRSVVRLTFAIDPSRMLSEMTGGHPKVCA